MAKDIKKFIAAGLKKLRRYIVYHPQFVPHLNGQGLCCWATIKTVLWNLLILLWGLTCIEICKVWVCNHKKDELNSYFIDAEKYLSHNSEFNLLLTITIVLGLICWLNHIWKDRYLSLKRFVVGVLLIDILAFGCTFTPVHSAIRLDYVAIMEIALIIQQVFDAKKLWNKRWRVGIIKKKELRYITELPQEGLDKKVRMDYARRVTDWLFNTDISEASFAVGITSEWGSGKTSFLLDMKNSMKGKCYIVDFKPWHCQEPDQIVNEFFEVFRKEIRNIYSPLYKPILRYAQLLSDVGLPSYMAPIFNFLPQMSHSIEAYKNKIESGLKQMDRPIVVTIDDMDRLAADEMFEVLRLIRNTAAFPNLIFIVCYDKDYVVRQIQNKGITESDLYLEKIFPLELSLPRTENEMLVETFRHALIDMHYLQGRHDWLINRLTSEEEQIMVRLLPTYRKMKRFARLLVTNSMFVVEKMGEKQIDVYDLFLIELVHFCMNDVYVVLRDEPEAILDVKMDERTNQARYILKSNYQNDLKENHIHRSLNKYEDLLLQKCFDLRYSDKMHYIMYVDSYMNYFCLATPNVMISKKEFEVIIKDRSTIRKNVHDWFWKIMPKKSASLYSRMMSVRKKELTLDEWKNHAYLIASWICESDDWTISEVLCQYLQKDNLRMEEQNAEVKAKEYINAKLGTMISGQKVNRMNMAKVLSGYYEKIEGKQADYLLNCSEIKELLKQNFLKFMEEKPSKQDAINVIALNGNDVNTFVKANHIVKVSPDNPLLDEGTIVICVNLIVDEVIKYFSAYEEKSSHLQEAQTLYTGTSNRYKTLPGLSGTDLEQERDYVFGTAENYQKFLSECFVTRT